MRQLPSACLLMLSLLPVSAQADVTHADAASLQIEHRIIVHTDAPTSFDALIHIERWWTAVRRSRSHEHAHRQLRYRTATTMRRAEPPQAIPPLPHSQFGIQS